MKKYAYILTACALALGWVSCSQDNGGTQENPVEINGIELVLNHPLEGEIPSSRNPLAGFAVNTVNDPTHDNISARTGWKLDFSIFIGGTEFEQSKGTYEWDGVKMWKYSGDTRYFPSYRTQDVKARLYPADWDAIAKDQSSSQALWGQDILIQHGLPTMRLVPAHIPSVELQHAHSMLDFVIQDVAQGDIQSVEVMLTGDAVPYRPLPLNPTSVNGRIEYMVILPIGVSNPVIRLTTKNAEAVYLQTVPINGTKVNTCYCFNLKGVELELTAITVTDWKIGEGIPGQYSAITTYPTFRGHENTSLYLYYDNGLDQLISFTADGERTLKPDGRTIVKITDATEQRNVIYDAATPGHNPIVLRSMYIDLRPYLNMPL